MNELNVFLHYSKNEKQLVGKLAEFNKKIFFEYSPAFLADPLWLSPYKLPPDNGLHEHKDIEFGPIFGLFDDSLPDGWGMLLMDSFFRKQGIDLHQVSVLDRLSFLGKSTMGALTYEPTNIRDKSDQILDLTELADESKKIISGEMDEVLPKLLNAGGSPGGARPKVLIGINKNTIISGEDDVPEGFEQWIVKFNPNSEFSDSGVIEYAYSLMAKEAGIVMPPTRLFDLGPTNKYFGIKRFDRNNNHRFHVHTFGDLIHSNFRIPGCDYETFLKVILNLTKNHQDLERGFRQMIFNIMVNNRDDHVKNFAFMINEHQEWTLTPAYDLTYSSGPGGEHSMSIAGEGQSPGKKEAILLGKKLGLSTNKINDILDQVRTAVNKWQCFAEDTDVSEQSYHLIQKTINNNLSLF